MGKASRKKRLIDSVKHQETATDKGRANHEGKIFLYPLLTISVISFLIYSNTLSSPFHFDDLNNIVDNEQIRSLNNFWPPSGTRYVGFLSFALNYYFGGLDVFGYHLVNIIIHIINGFLVWWLVILTFRTPVMERTGINPQLKYLIAMTSSLIFISHPIQTQAVTYIVQRFTSFAMLFYLLSFALYIKARLVYQNTEVGSQKSKERQRGFNLQSVVFYLLSVISAILAMKTKEISFTLPFLILLYEFMFLGGNNEPSTKRILCIAPLLLTLLIIPLSMIGIDKPVGDLIGELREATQETEVISRKVYLLTQFTVIATYIRLLFIPVNQNLDYDYPEYQSLFEPAVSLSFLLLLSIFCFAVYLFVWSRKNRNIYFLLSSFGICWFFITLSVESSIIPIQDVIFEHRLYLPSMGVVIAFSSGVFYVFDRSNIKNLLLALVLLLVFTVIPLSIATYKRNFIWKDGVTLWRDVINKSPNKPRGYNMLGLVYTRKGMIDEAIKAHESFAQRAPNLPNAHNNLGVLYYNKGRIEQAIEEFRIALRLHPNNIEVVKILENLAQANYALGRSDEAIKDYRVLLSFNPNSTLYHEELGDIYYKLGQIGEAIKLYRKVVEIEPDNIKVHNKLADVYVKSNRMDNAIIEYNKIISLNPDFVYAYNNLGNIYFTLGRINEAIEEYKNALRRKPDFADAYNNLGGVYYNEGFIDKAIENFKAAINLKPNDANAHYNLGLAYAKKGLKDMAIKEFKGALTINQDYEKARNMLKSLSR